MNHLQENAPSLVILFEIRFKKFAYRIGKYSKKR